MQSLPRTHPLASQTLASRVKTWGNQQDASLSFFSNECWLWTC